MASNLIVEDGTGKADASTYADAAAIRAYATARGVTLAPEDGDGDAIVDQMTIKAMDYIEAKRGEFAGWRAFSNQRLSFPRDGIPAEYQGQGTTVVNGFENPTTSVGYRPVAPLPPELLEAQCALVMQVKAGVDLMPTIVSGQFIKREKIGPMETEYSEAIGVYTLPQMPVVDALLAGLLKARGPMLSFRR